MTFSSSLQRRRLDAIARVALFLVACLSISLMINLFFLATEDTKIMLQWQHHMQLADSLVAKVGGDGVKPPYAAKIVAATTIAAKIVAATTTTTAADEYPYLNRTKGRLAGLSCDRFGGPPDEIAAEMIYWRDIPSDASYTPSFHDDDDPTSNRRTEQFLLWDVDPAGFNNKRISFENFILLAHATGRTLVMPPKGVWWGFSAKPNKTAGVTDVPNRWSMQDFYDIEQIAAEQAGFKIISMQDFLAQHALTGKLVTAGSGTPLFPPSNRTDWNSLMQRKLKQYLKQVTTPLTWRPEACLGAFPSSAMTVDNNDKYEYKYKYKHNNAHRNNHDSMDAARQEILKHKGPQSPQHWIGRPTPVDASVRDRLEEVLTDRRNLCFYTEELQKAPYLYYKILYDPRNYTLTFDINIRLLIYYYCFLFFQDWHQDLWSKRFIRDHLRYKDAFHCAAARIVQALRALAMSGDFDVLHIRRHGEFESQYGNLTTAEEIVQSIRTAIPKDRTVYIATDEPDRAFFRPIEEYLDNRIWFLKDFLHLIPDLDVNFYSIIDQLVATRGTKFFGAFCSTFTGHINRMRGYHSTKSKWEGYEEGALVDSFFYNFNAEGKRDKMTMYHPPVKTWFFREFPIAWRDIDHDVDHFAG